jgi:hypothetical protein
VTTKGGHTRSGREWGLDGRPEYLRESAGRVCPGAHARGLPKL